MCLILLKRNLNNCDELFYFKLKRLIKILKQNLFRATRDFYKLYIQAKNTLQCT